MTLDVLYVAWNRLDFTRFSFEMLLRNTDWDLVQRLVVHDDGSDDGTAEYLHEATSRVPVEVSFSVDPRRSPPAVMNGYVDRDDAAEWFAKIDNDIVVPPGWLNVLVDVVGRYPEIDLLGTEAGRMDIPRDGFDGVYGWTAGSHIGGVGLMRVAAFLRHRKLDETGGRFGFTEWQHEFEPTRGWVTPDLLISSLDQIPADPWRSLSRGYVEAGWQRFWPEYHERYPYYWGWWATEAADVLEAALAAIEVAETVEAEA